MTFFFLQILLYYHCFPHLHLIGYHSYQMEHRGGIFFSKKSLIVFFQFILPTFLIIGNFFFYCFFFVLTLQSPYSLICYAHLTGWGQREFLRWTDLESRRRVFYVPSWKKKFILKNTVRALLHIELSNRSQIDHNLKGLNIIYETNLIVLALFV